MAASHYFDDAFWCVADLAHSPFAGEQFDAILNILSPSHYEEFGRLLKKGGVVVKGVPDADYLIELRQKLFMLEEEKQSYENEPVIKRFEQAYPNYLHEHVRYEVSLTAEVYRWLLEMTPLTWGADEGKRLELLAEPLPSITVAMSVLVGIK